MAGERTIGLSLWRPDLTWREPDALGPELEQLPEELWLVGLGHLGQAYAWTVGCLPYADRAETTLYLQDSDHLVTANLGTSLLATNSDLGTRKARLVAAALDQLDFGTVIIERDLDPALRVGRTDPPVALIGVDKPNPRHWLSEHGWKQVIDSGLGDDARDYLGSDIRELAADEDSRDVWPLRSGDRSTTRLEAQPGYQRLLEETGDRCGVQLLAGRAVATAFVGVVAAALAVAAACRPGYAGGRRYRLTSLHLRNPESRETLPQEAPEVLPVNFQRVAGRLRAAS